MTLAPPEVPVAAPTTVGPDARPQSRPRPPRGKPPRGPRPSRPRPPVQPPVRRVASPAGQVVSTALLTLAGLCAWVVLQAFSFGAVTQARSQEDLHDQLRLSLAAQTAPLGGVIEPGAPVALLEIPTLGLEQVVVEGTASGDTLEGPGHLRSSPLPGQRGISQVYGRSGLFGAPFRNLATLRTGDGIRVTTGQGEFVYRVDRVRREGDPLPVQLAAGGGRLTLVTAESAGWAGPFQPTGAVFVDATLQGEPALAPPGRPGAVPAAEAAMASDVTGLPLLVFCIQGLLAAVVGTGIARRHAPSRVVWVLGAPVVLAFLWLTAEQVARLLPNLA